MGTSSPDALAAANHDTALGDNHRGMITDKFPVFASILRHVETSEEDGMTSGRGKNNEQAAKAGRPGNE